MIRLTSVHGGRPRWINPRYIVWMQAIGAQDSGNSIVQVDGDPEPLQVRESVDEILMQGRTPDAVDVWPNPVSVSQADGYVFGTGKRTDDTYNKR